MSQITNHIYGEQSITSQPWWQIFIIISTAIITAVATQAIAHIFLLKRKKKDQIIELCGRLQATADKIAINLQFFIEYDVDFLEQQKMVVDSIKAKDMQSYEIHKKAAFNSEKKALRYRERFVSARDDFTTSLYLLTAIHNRRFENEKNFLKATRKIREVVIEERKDFEVAKKEIEKKLKTQIKIVQDVCHEVIYEQNMGLFERLWSKKGTQ